MSRKLIALVLGCSSVAWGQQGEVVSYYFTGVTSAGADVEIGSVPAGGFVLGKSYIG